MIAPGEINIRCIATDADRQRWDEFVRACPDGTFFHLSAWQGLIEEVFGHRTQYVLAEHDGEFIGVLPLSEVKSRLFGHSVSSLAFCAYGGAIGTETARTSLEEFAQSYSKEVGAEYLELRNMTRKHADWPRQELYVTFRKAISPDDEANMNAIPRKQRAMVRKAIKRELRSEIDSDARRFFALYSDNVRRHGTPCFSKRLFDELLLRFRGSCDVLTVVDNGGLPVSSVLSFYFRNEVLPYYAGDDVTARALAANDFKYWELMRRAAASGYTVFDFGRSKVGTGPWSFKKNWGFEPQPLSYEYQLYKLDGIPQKNPLNPKYRALIAAWRKLPLPIANFLGPFISRYLG